MSGSSRSIQSCTFAGLRVAGLTFTPEYSKNGGNVSAKLQIDSFCNDDPNSDPAKRETINFTVWGKRAHTLAKCMSPGREWNCTARVKPYRKRVWIRNPQTGQMEHLVDPSTGNPIKVKTSSFTVEKMSFGAESRQHIMTELNNMYNGRPIRPAGWDIPNHPDQAAWKDTLKARMAIQFDRSMKQYGFAEVKLPTGDGIGAYIPGQQSAQEQAGETTQVDMSGNVAAVTAAFGHNAQAQTGNPTFNTWSPAPMNQQPQTSVNNGKAINQQGFVVPAGM